jgi:beta-glucosidase
MTTLSGGIVSQTPANLAALVDTRTWTSGGGNTFPGADVPFGMVQWSPDTSPDRSAGGGYGTWGAVGSSQPPAGLSGKVWRGDSLQVAATSGVPGSSAAVSTASTNGHYEYGAALTPQGAQAYRWIAPAGVATGPVTDAAVQVTRDDATDTTLYELALPWSDLTSAVQPGAGTVFSISALLNDTDNSTREAFLQWGGGIGPDKNVGEFNMAQLMP